MNSGYPLFSIILPTYNRAHLLPRAVDSVLAQTFADYELIIVDDASTDGTREVVSSFADPRIVYLRQDENQGVSAARNAGICRARGDWITFFDDDDELLPSALQAIDDLFQKQPSSVGFCWCGIRIVRVTSAGEMIWREKKWEAGFNGKPPALKKFTHLYVGTGYALTVRKECFDAIGLFDESLPVFVDLDLLIRLGQEFDGTAVPGVHVKVYRHEENQLTDVSPRRIAALESIIQKHKDYLNTERAVWMALHRQLVSMLYRLGDKVRGRRYMGHILRKHPHRLMAWKMLLSCEVFGTKGLGLKRLLTSG